MIELQGLNKSYGDKHVVSDVGFTAPDAAITYMLGPNGAGKSTVLRMLAGLTRPDSGTLLIDGQPLHDLEDPIGTVGFSLGAALNPTLTASEHLTWQADLGGVDRKRVPLMLKLVGLATVADKKVGAFSLGMKQRLGIASALLGDPQTLVFDEPANGLDVDGVLWLRDFFTYLARRRGKCLLIASHDLPEIALTANRITVMGRGRLLADERAADFMARGDGPRPLESAYVALTNQNVEYVSAVKERR